MSLPVHIPVGRGREAEILWLDERIVVHRQRVREVSGKKEGREEHVRIQLGTGEEHAPLQAQLCTIRFTFLCSKTLEMFQF